MADDECPFLDDRRDEFGLSLGAFVVAGAPENQGVRSPCGLVRLIASVIRDNVTDLMKDDVVLMDLGRFFLVEDAVFVRPRHPEPERAGHGQ
ncbi:hypothetical protein [Streptomyces goshikiensis]|uniref:hypothetical protein n=1 Tax=Streptomyces goshikiensis TaxID=1942 RepID=UPI0036A0B529